MSDNTHHPGGSTTSSPCFSKQNEDTSNTLYDYELEVDKGLLTSPFNPPASSFIAADHPGLQASSSNNNIKVICRFRPEDDSEKNRGNVIVSFPDSQSVTVDGRDGASTYTFDRVFQADSTQEEIYKFSVYKSVDDLFNGYNGTILAYGQTGSGKSYTMLGATDSKNNQGVIPRISQEIFARIQNGSSEIEYTVGVSFMELHLEQINDLIDTSNNNNPDHKFSIHSDKANGIYVKGLSQAFVSSVDELNLILLQGLKFRTSVSTNMNIESSRSHAIFQIKLTQKHILSGIMKRSHLFLVDLAGSEKVDKTGAQGQTLEEAKKINSSLSTLGNVINALTDGKSTHIPYRDSKLTRILQESLGGNSRTSLIINCSPSSLNEPETLSTLRFGNRTKNIKNTAHINTELSASTLRQKLSQLEKTNDNNQLYIKQLELELAQWRNGDKERKIHISQSQSQLPRSSSIPIGANIPSSVRNSMISPRTPTKLPVPVGAVSGTASTGAALAAAATSNNPTPGSRIPSGGMIPIPASSSPLPPSKSTFQLSEDIERRDKKIAELEQIILGMKMNNLRSSHAEDSKLFALENSLYKISNKLNDVEAINDNLRKHLLISEKIIESRDLKINKLKGSLKEQQVQISRETLGFRHKLGDIQQKLDILNKEKQEEIYSQARESIMRESMYSVDSKARDSMFYLDNKTRETFIDMDQRSFLEEQKNARRDANMVLRHNESKLIHLSSSIDDQSVKEVATFSSEIPIVSASETDSRHSVKSMRTIDEHRIFRTPVIAQKGFDFEKKSLKRFSKVAPPTEDDDSLPECDLDDVQLPESNLTGDDLSGNELSGNELSVNDEKTSNSETLTSTGEDSKMNLKRFSLIATKKRDSGDENDKSMSNKSVSLIEHDSTILNFHQEFLSIGEFLAESKSKTGLVDTIRNSISDLNEDTSETSGMFDDPPNSPKAGLNLRIVKPLRGGNIIQKMNLFQ
ncbi:kinesin-domain-containing protein [Suhomyces tanzawaensis NRRL Y-17324]|uniref:Kinesin-like protein n=1 Tax=Suhomyces tanzawaensis NRRL Y-17324 TaxID=984487 RepID=A0A1E4SI25_9ASCO|nr:kinesin-domain-containing protein [Suhomyces tanzawaensis NRRL Y-17324]ODV79168.1 kinesin-domain-containing protein [Suhomyces tanzawaensis NRRL Y-17324]